MAVVISLVGLPASHAWADQAVSEPVDQDGLSATETASDTDAAVLPGTNPYARTKRRFPRTDGTRAELGTRGYFPNYQCLQTSDPCLSRAGNFRPEATAQARVIQALGEDHHLLAQEANAFTSHESGLITPSVSLAGDLRIRW